MTEKERKSLYQIIGSNIRALREKNSLRQGALAEMLDLSRASIVNIEKGRQQVSLHLLLDIAQILKVEFTELLKNINLMLNKPAPTKELHSVKFGDRYNSKAQKEAEKQVMRFLSTINISPNDKKED